jgi:dihydroflavonol-4-reductase
VEPDLWKAMRGADGVFHIAALYKLGLELRDQMRAANVDGTRYTLEAAIAAGVPKIVYTSTVAVFGNTGRIAVRRTGNDLALGMSAPGALRNGCAVAADGAPV